MNWIPWALGGGLLLLLTATGKKAAAAAPWFALAREAGIAAKTPWRFMGTGPTRQAVEAQMKSALEVAKRVEPGAPIKFETKFFQAVPDVDVWMISMNVPGQVPIPLVLHESKKVADEVLEEFMGEAGREIEKTLPGTTISMKKVRVPRSVLTGRAML